MNSASWMMKYKNKVVPHDASTVISYGRLWTMWCQPKKEKKKKQDSRNIPQYLNADQSHRFYALTIVQLIVTSKTALKDGAVRK